MTTKPTYSRVSPLGFLIVLMILSMLSFNMLTAQPKYRTFNQSDLAEKKAKAGKAYASKVCFKFYNTTASTVNDLHIKFNATITSVDDSGGFSVVGLSAKGKVLDAGGKDIPPGASVTICVTSSKKAPGTIATNWWWTINSIQEGEKNTNLLSISDVQVLVEPNGGNVLEHLYKKVITRPVGVVVGIARVDSPGVYGWIRYMKADRKYFPHTGTPRCFDEIAAGIGRTKPFLKELKNPHVKKHDNHLLGELHALKLACIANDSGVTEPLDSGVTLFSTLLYNDTVNGGDICNGKSISEIVHLADSALTYCDNFDSVGYAALDACISRINAAFDGPYEAASLSPFVIKGTHNLADVYFLHPNPIAVPFTRSRSQYALANDQPEQFELVQNYPNPFNPTTTIQFSLPEPALVTLKIYNMLGQEVATLFDREQMDDGVQDVEFDANNFSSGIYFYRITAEGIADEDGLRSTHVFTLTKKMLLVK